MPATPYVLLPRANANRVYGAAAPGLAAAELGFLARALLPEAGMGDIGPARLAGVDYVGFSAGRPLMPDELALVGNLAGLHALYQRAGDGGDLLRPVEAPARRVTDDDVVSIQRYPGKTNEQFTHLLVNVTLAAAGDAFPRLLAGDTVRLLDPVCGRGTALNRAVVYGMDAVGIEVDGRDVDAWAQFFGTWLKDKRLKHTTEAARLRRGRATPARRLAFAYGSERKGPRRRAVIVQDDTVLAGDHVPAKTVDVMVADLPYGVQHGARPEAGRLSRSPEELLVAALPVWRSLLTRRGALGLAWNRRTLARSRLVALAADAGLHPAQASDEESFAHRVDRAITRDVLVLTREPHPRLAAGASPPA